MPRPAYLAALLLMLPMTSLAAAVPLDAATIAAIDTSAREWLAASGAPSVSLAIVRQGVLGYVQAYGLARASPPLPASSSTRYAIDSVSKQFTAAAVLLLAEQGRLSLSDRVARWYPDLGAASEIRLRELLDQTSGLRDYWPQDFVPPAMLLPTTRAAIFDQWIRRPLDFEPGTEWQYSNTGYVLAGSIIERVSGQSLQQFLQQHIFAPLGMQQVSEDDGAALPPPDALGYSREGLARPHVAPKEGAGWLFGAAGLQMTARDIAHWDLSLLQRSLLQPASYEAMFKPVTLRNGVVKDYGLGLAIEHVQGRLRIGHDGSGSGFQAANRLWPEDGTAIVVLTNNDWASPDALIDRLAFALLRPRPEEARARAVFEGMQQGSLDLQLFTDNGRAYLSDAVRSALQQSLQPLGPPRLIQLEQESRRGGMLTRRWRITCRSQVLRAVERSWPQGKLEQFSITAAEY
jgi:CubicO group peptidase (beta-lactamase class C family)